MTLQALTGVPFRIVRPQPFYTIEGVSYPYPNGQRVSVQVTADLLDDGRSRTHPQWVEYWKQTGWSPGSGPLEYALFASLHDNRGAVGVEELRRLFAEDFKSCWMMTATGVTYRPSGLDLVTHDAGTPEARTLEVRLTGPDGPINDEMSDEIRALLGSPDVRKVSDVYEWITGHDSNGGYLWRVNESPKTDAVLALLVVCGGFSIGTDSDFGYGRPARGVRIAPQTTELTR